VTPFIVAEGVTSAQATCSGTSGDGGWTAFSRDPLEDEDLTGRTVDRYAIVALIATGGHGRVYRASDKRLHRDVAIKVARIADPATRLQLMAEARILSLVHHPNIGAVHDFVVTRERAFIVMEFVPGATLRDVLASGPLPPSEVARLGADIARGLGAAHAAGVVHGDVKPSNLKITSAGELKILDFGVAQVMPAGVSRGLLTRPAFTGSVVGTVPYMAPEQLRGEEIDGRTDIFSLGAVLYEMATGRRAFPQRDLPQLIDAVHSQDPRLPTSVNPYLPMPMEDLIVRALQKDRAARQQSAGEVAESLEAMMAGVCRPAGAGARIDPPVVPPMRSNGAATAPWRRASSPAAG
jgi:serine/threonine protein kinase